MITIFYHYFNLDYRYALVLGGICDVALLMLLFGG